MNPFAKMWQAFKAWLKSMDEAWDEELASSNQTSRTCRDLED